MKIKLLIIFALFSFISCHHMTNGEYFSRGNKKYENYDYVGAIEDYTKAIEINSKDAEAYYSRGMAKHELGNYNGALVDYTKAIEINPKYAAAYCRRGDTKYMLRDYNGGIADYNKAIGIDPMYADAYCNRGNILALLLTIIKLLKLTQNTRMHFLIWD